MEYGHYLFSGIFLEVPAEQNRHPRR